MKKLLLIAFAFLSAEAYAQPVCNASISTSVSQNVVTLTNSSTPTSSTWVYVWYNINWGDGNNQNVSNNNNQNHTYSVGGNYVIRLIQHVMDSSKNPPQSCVDTAYDSVSVSVTQQNKIGGVIWVDSTSSLDSYKVWLIQYNSTTNILSAVDSQIVTTMAGSGNYVFNGKAAGSYRTKAARHNGPTSGTGHVPTYHNSALLWSAATVITHTGGSSMGKDIYMLKGALTSGPGFVGGNVTQGANKGTANGIAGMNILLLDAADNVITYTVTDATGNYSFTGLPNATYKIHPEDMNYTTTVASVNVTVGAPSHAAINFERSLSQKTIVPVPAGISDINSKELAFGLYPNPASNVVTLAWATITDDKAVVMITDISGKNVLSTEVKMNANATINIQDLQAGFYFLNVVTEFGSSTQKLVIE